MTDDNMGTNSKKSLKEPKLWKKYFKKAERYLDNDADLDNLLSKAKRKASKQKDRVSEAVDDLSTAQRIVTSSVKGKYKPGKTLLVSLVAALLYFVIPTDLIPDFILGWGYIDDLSVLAFVFGRFQNEIKDFNEWEDENKEDK